MVGRFQWGVFWDFLCDLPFLFLFSFFFCVWTVEAFANRVVVVMLRITR